MRQIGDWAPVGGALGPTRAALERIRVLAALEPPGADTPESEWLPLCERAFGVTVPAAPPGEPPSGHLVATLAQPCSRCSEGYVPRWDETGSWLEECRCAAHRQAAARFSRGRVPSGALRQSRHSYDWARLKGGEAHARAVRCALGDAVRGPGGGVLIYGPCGSGKTHLSVAVVRAAALEQGRSVLWLRWPSLLLRLKESLGQRGSGGVGPSELIQARTADVLALDELGGERDSDWSRDTLLDLLDTASARGATVVATTNLDDAARRTRLGQRAASRLAALKELSIDCDDYRREK